MRTLLMAAMLLLCGCADALDAQSRSAHALKVRDAMAYEDARDLASASAWHARETADRQAAAIAAGITSPTQAAE